MRLEKRLKKRLQRAMRFGIVLTMIKGSYIEMSLAMLLSAASASAAFAATGVRVDAPTPEYADMEASAEMPLPEWGSVSASRTTLRITLSLDAATAESSAEIALGNYTPGDDPDGTAVVMGYEDGEFFILGDRLLTRLAVPAASPPPSGPRTLTARIRLDAAGKPTGVTFEADGNAVPSGGLAPDPEILPAWFDPANAGILRVTSRGGAQNVSATVTAYADGTIMILK